MIEAIRRSERLHQPEVLDLFFKKVNQGLRGALDPNIPWLNIQSVANRKVTDSNGVDCYMAVGIVIPTGKRHRPYLELVMRFDDQNTWSLEKERTDLGACAELRRLEEYDYGQGQSVGTTPMIESDWVLLHPTLLPIPEVPAAPVLRLVGTDAA